MPRRERSRGTEPVFGPDSLDWAELGPEPGLESTAEIVGEEPTRESSRPEGPRRRRRRRGRRRDRPGGPEPSTGQAADEFEDDLTYDEADSPAAAPPLPHPQARRPEPPRPLNRLPAPVEDDVLGHEFDFGEQEEADEFQDDIDDDLLDSGRSIPNPDDEIDPGLEEEIRRESRGDRRARARDGTAGHDRGPSPTRRRP